MLEVIDVIKRQDPDAVIILHGDHGGRLIDDQTLNDKQLQSSILCAIHFGSVKIRSSYRLRTLTNIYRYFINCAFDTNYPMLPDEVFFSGADDIYSVTNITQEILNSQ
jgi:hypothetical protein